MKIIATLLLAVLYLPLAGAANYQFDLFSTDSSCSSSTADSYKSLEIGLTAEEKEAQCATHCCTDNDYFLAAHSGVGCKCAKKESCEGDYLAIPQKGYIQYNPQYDLFKCGAPISPSSGGDPHFKTFNGTKFDFHGGCDLVLLSNPDFDNGKGLEIHGRTKIESTWSFIESAAVQIGDNTLEIKGGKKQISYWLDGVEVNQMETGDATLGDHAIHFNRMSEYQSQTRVDLGHGNAMSIETYKLFTRVNTKVLAAEKFVGTYGMFGNYPEGKLVGRDKATVFEDTNEFGFEWQVRATDPQLFHSVGPVQFPMKCAMPDMTKRSQVRRRLGESAISEEDAALACARVSEADKDACIFDVMATNDKGMAGSY